MEYQEKTKWLGRYRESVCRQRMLEDELAALRSDAERMTACISGMPGRGGVNADRLPKAVERIEEAQKSLEQQVGICLDERMDVMNAILSVGDESQREVLRRRYIAGESFGEIAADLGLVPRRVYQLHRQGVNGVEPVEKKAKNISQS